MKTAIHFAAIVAVTLFFLSAFWSAARQPSTVVATEGQHDADVAQVVIVGKPFTLVEKVQYKASVFAQWMGFSSQNNVLIAKK